MIINFPYYKFKQYEDVKFTSYDDIDKYVFTDVGLFYKKELTKFVKRFESLYLFEGLMLRVLKLTFDPKFEIIKEKQLLSKSKPKLKTVSNLKLFVQALNFRIDLNKILLELEKIERNNLVTINKDQLIDELVKYTYKYLFIKYSKLIFYYISLNSENIQLIIDFKKNHMVFKSYKKSLQKNRLNDIDKTHQQEFVDSYFKVFNTKDEKIIEALVEEILIYDNPRKSAHKLNSIIENNILFNEKLSNKAANKILLPLYKMITCQYHFRENLDYKLEDPILIEKFKKFRQQSKKRS